MEQWQKADALMVMEQKIKKHNSTVLNSPKQKTTAHCNCRKKEECPLKGECLSECLVYEASVKAGDIERKYYGLTEGPFKTRYRNHTKSFNNLKYRNETELSKYIWDKKEKNQSYELSWKIAAKTHPYMCGTKRCDLCITEKVLIALSDPNIFLNKRDEIVSKCRHKNKFKLRVCK